MRNNPGKFRWLCRNRKRCSFWARSITWIFQFYIETSEDNNCLVPGALLLPQVFPTSISITYLSPRKKQENTKCSPLGHKAIFLSHFAIICSLKPLRLFTVICFSERETRKEVITIQSITSSYLFFTRTLKRKIINRPKEKVNE